MNQKETFDILDYIPNNVICGKNNKSYNLNIDNEDDYISLSYIVNQSNNSKREHNLIIPRHILKNQETFEVLGLLQAEMGKTQNGCLVFANSEPKIINKVMKWFKKELDISFKDWRWYIRINLDLANEDFRKELEKEIIDFWLVNSKIDYEKRYPKTLVGVKDSNNNIPKNKGTIMIEIKKNLFSQIIKRFLKLVITNLINEKKEYIGRFMKGVLAGEGCIAYHPKSGHYAVHISASELGEREIYKECLKKLNIEIKIYNNYKEMLISKKHNLIQLLQQRLMTLHPVKYNKFLNMMKQYPDITEKIGYFSGNKRPWNKTPKEKINKILELYKSGTTNTKEIADKIGIGRLKVQRVLKENNLGKRLERTSQKMMNKIIRLHNKNPSLHSYQIANILGIHESRVGRIRRKYKLKKMNFYKKQQCASP